MIILNGKEVSRKIKNEIKEKIQKENLSPLLVVIRVGDDPASETYVKSKNKSCNEVGIKFKEIHLKKEEKEENIINMIKLLNNDSSVSGILVQLPLPSNLDTDKIINTILPSKDVDGLTNTNKCSLLNNNPIIIPCTPKGIIYLLKEYQIPIKGKNIVIVGRSKLVGRPLIDLLLNENATITICHSHTENIKEHTINADILISAVGKKNIIKSDMIKANAVVIDVGINKENGKIYGDVEESVYDKVSYITPVPGGIGPMTVAMLLQNTIQCYMINKK